MNYRHIYHAGNHADVLKHALLCWCLSYLGRKPAPYAVLDTHAGIGGYDLTAAEAQRSPEWRGGIGRLLDRAEAPALLGPYLAAVRAAAPAYPGSPALALALMRAEDRLMACELHPEDAASLKRALKADKRAQVHHRDGYEALGALLPPPEKRALVLIDPPYERTDELALATAGAGLALRRCPGAVVLWWRPLKEPEALARADAELSQLGRPLLRCDLAVAAPARVGPLTASSVLIVNPPFGLEPAAADALPALAARLAAGPGAAGRVWG